MKFQFYENEKVKKKTVFCPNANKNKEFFITEKEANKFIRINNLKMWVYKCDECDGFHLTSKEPQDYKKSSNKRKPKKKRGKASIRMQ